MTAADTNNNNNRWMNDDELTALLGEWWTEEMELHNSATMEMNVEIANRELRKRSLPYAVLECRGSADGENLDWRIHKMPTMLQFQAAKQKLLTAGWVHVANLLAADARNRGVVNFGSCWHKAGQVFWLNYKTIDTLPEDTSDGEKDRERATVQ